VTGRVDGVLPYWLDRPDDEAVAVAEATREAGLAGLWVGEMATFDAFALATAAGGRTRGELPLTIGPLAAGVRSPVAVALGLSSVATLTGAEAGIALGASSPMIVAGWHDREWAHAAARTRETIEALRPILAGERADYDGEHVRAHGFRLRAPLPGARITVAAFGPAMTRVAARHADEVVLNLVPPSHVAAVRATIDAEATAAGRDAAPDLAVWVPAALDPGDAARAQMAAQLAVYIGPPGYGEMFTELGFGALVERARAGARRSELAADIPFELLAAVGALGTAEEVAARVAEYHAAGADRVGIAPSTAEDPAGLGVLRAARPT
jgi:probable F420-dependent oxidoreductase